MFINTYTCLVVLNLNLLIYISYCMILIKVFVDNRYNIKNAKKSVLASIRILPMKNKNKFNCINKFTNCNYHFFFLLIKYRNYI